MAVILALLGLFLISSGVRAAEPSPVVEDVEDSPVVEDVEDSGKADDGPLEWEIDGFVKERLRYRHVESENDLDLLSDLAANLVHHGEFPFRLGLRGRLIWDIVGNEGSDDLLRDYWDSFGGDAQARLYEAYGQFDDLFGWGADVRIGRQFLEEGQWFQFDGIRADVDLGKQIEDFDVTAVFGVPVIVTDVERRGNWMVGAVLRKRFETDTRVRLEYYHVAEDFEGINDPLIDALQQPETAEDDTLHDDYWGLSVWQRLDPGFHLFGRFSLLESDANELELRARWSAEDGVWSAVLEYEQMFDRLRNVTNDLSPYVPLLGSYEPFWKAGGRVDYRPDDDWQMQAGYSRRELTDTDDEGTFNHTYDRYFATATRFGLADERLDLSVVANAYDSSLNDIVAVGGQADFRLSTDVTLGGGVDYSLFKYDYFTDTEREDVWTWWLDVRWKESRDLEVRGRVSVDDDDFNTWTTVEISLIVRF